MVDFCCDCRWIRAIGASGPIVLRLIDLRRNRRTATERGVAYAPGVFFFMGGQGSASLRLAFAALPASRIEEGVRRLGDVVREALRRRRAVTPRPALPVV